MTAHSLSPQVRSRDPSCLNCQRIKKEQNTGSVGAGLLSWGQLMGAASYQQTLANPIGKAWKVCRVSPRGPPGG